MCRVLEELLGHARRIRHVLDAWCTLALCPVLGGISWVGLPLGELCGFVGIGTALRLTQDKRPRQGLLLFVIFSAWILVSPFTRPTGKPIFQSPTAPTQPPTEIPFQVSQIAARIPSNPVSSERHLIPVPGGLSDQLNNPETISQPAVTINPTATSEAGTEGFIATTQEAPIRDLPREAEAVVQSWWEARYFGNIDKAVSLHAEQSSFGGPLLSPAELRQSIATDWKRNGSVHETTFDTFRVSQAGEAWTVECHTRFSFQVRDSTIPVRGQCLHTFTLSDRGGSLRITDHRDAIIPVVPPSSSDIAGMKAADLRRVASGCLEADLKGDITSSMDAYDAHVRYFGQSQTRDQIRADKLAYFQRWPKRSELFEGMLQIARAPGNRATCSFRSSFRTESPERGEWCKGSIDHHFVFTISEGRPLIVEQSATVLESHKGKF